MRKIASVVALALALLTANFYFVLNSWGGSGAANLVAGWNLLGNSSSTSLNVAATFGNSSQVTTVWKWMPSSSTWAFYTPTLGDGGAAYAASKGYGFLSSIGAGEGFWVNAKTTFTAQLPAGTSISSASFRSTLGAGWNLVASGDNTTPSQFNQALSTVPPATGAIPANLITLWSWDAAIANWYFYAPSLEAQGGTALSDYITNKAYLNFGTKTLDPALGFWVNRSAPPAAIVLASTDLASAMPMSILTLSGTGFDTTATTLVRFFDGNQYSVDVAPIRLSSTSIAVAVPPYFNSTSTAFIPGSVSLKVIQTSGAGTRTSGALAGFQILDLPNSSGAAGAVTLNFLQALQTQAATLQNSVAGTSLSALLTSALASQASAVALLVNTVQPVVADASKRAAMGTLNGTSVNMGASELRQTDRLLLGMALALGNGTSTIASAGNTTVVQLHDRPPGSEPLQSKSSRATKAGAPLQLAYNGALDQLALSVLLHGLLADPRLGAANGARRSEIIQLAQAATTGACMQTEASSFAQCGQGDPSLCNSLAIVRAPYNNVLCGTPAAFNTSLAVVSAGAVAVIAVAGLIGGTAVAGTVAGAGGVLALAGYLAYATILSGGFQIGIGGVLGQSSAAGKQLVEGGIKQINDFVRDTAISAGIGNAAGTTAGIVNDVVTTAKNLGDVLAQTVSPTTTQTTTTQTTTATTTSTTTTVTTTTTTTQATAYCACLFDIYTNGGTWICQNTNTWYTSGGYLMNYGKCVCDAALYQVCR